MKPGMVRTASARLGWLGLGVARHGNPRQGKVGQGSERLGEAPPGRAIQGKALTPHPGSETRGSARRGRAGHDPAGQGKPKRTYSVVRDGNDGYGVRCDQTHHFVNEEPIETEAKANRFLEALEDGGEL